MASLHQQPKPLQRTWNAHTSAAYAHGARQAEYLSAEEERRLALAWRNEKDTDARNRLVESHLQLVMAISKDFHKGGAHAADDLISIGTIGLIKAVDRYDPDNEQGARLSTYAAKFIRNDLKEATLKSSSIYIATTKGNRKALFNISQERRNFEADERPLSASEISAMAERLNIAPDVVRMIDQFHCQGVVESLDYCPNPGSSRTYGDLIPSPGPTPEEIATQRELVERASAAFGKLDKRSQYIFTQRYVENDPATLGDLGGMFGISPERVRQLAEAAFKKVVPEETGRVSGDGKRQTKPKPKKAQPAQPA